MFRYRRETECLPADENTTRYLVHPTSLTLPWYEWYPSLTLIDRPAQAMGHGPWTMDHGRHLCWFVSYCIVPCIRSYRRTVCPRLPPVSWFSGSVVPFHFHFHLHLHLHVHVYVLSKN